MKRNKFRGFFMEYMVFYGVYGVAIIVENKIKRII
jgi:hypothetical protein